MKRRSPVAHRAQPGSFRVMGVDPGLTKMGLVVLEMASGMEKPRLVTIRMVETPGTPAKDRKRLKMRVSHDDQRRMKLQWEALKEEAEGVVAIGVETYAPQVGLTGKNAWKTAWSFQLACCFAWTLGITPNPQRPDDLKRALLGTNKGGKVQIVGAAMDRIEGLGEALDGYSPTTWEHLADAAGHAYLAIQNYLE